jgi:hypothetical protein
MAPNETCLATMLKLRGARPTGVRAAVATLSALTVLASGCASGGGNTLAQDLA